MRQFLIGILAIFIVSCTNTTESLDEKNSLEFSTGINFPELNIHLEKINELIIEFEQPLLNRLSFEKSVPILFTYKFNIIEYSKSFTLNELIDNNYQVSICDKILRDELVLLKSKYDLTKNKL